MTEVLFDEWRAYEKVVFHDYMNHRLFFGKLEAIVRDRFSGPVRILDLGCGDTQPIRPLLESVAVSQYVGVDESPEALARAESALTDLGMRFELHRGDLAAFPADRFKNFDLVVASFSLHHLPDTEAKRALVAACREMLSPGGLVAVIDVFRDESETRAAYIERWVAHAQARFAALDAAELVVLTDHVRRCDYAAPVSEYAAIAETAGFMRVTCAAADPLNRLVLLEA